MADPDPEIIHDAQVTPAHVLDAVNSFKADVTTRLDRLERTVKESGLNGHTPYLKSFLEQYAASYTTRQAWITVRSDIGSRLRFLRSPKGWLKAILYAVIGGLFTGWATSGHITLPHIPGL